jgi:hypothetical protein
MSKVKDEGLGTLPLRWSSELKTAFDTPNATASVRAALMRRQNEKRTQLRTGRVFLFAAPVVLVLAAATVFLLKPTPKLGFFVESAPAHPGIVGQTVTASLHKPLGIRFFNRSEDGELALQPDASVRIDQMSDLSVKLALLQGTVLAHVTSSESRPWNVTVGAQSVTVLAAHFELSKLIDGVFVKVTEGNVSVSSPCSEVQIVAAGSHASIVCPLRQVLPESVEPAVVSVVAPPLPIRVAAVRQPMGKSLSAPIQNDRLRREVMLVDRMRAELDKHPEQTLQLGKQVQANFPAGMLAEETEAMSIIALDALGRHEEARSRASRFVATFPSGAFHVRIRKLSESKPSQ